MRPELRIVIGIALCASGAGCAGDPADPRTVRASFLAAHQPQVVIDVDAGWSGRAELLDPASALPRSFDFDRSELAALRQYREACGAAPMVSPGLAKALAWAAGRCGDAPLPADFFDTAPWMSPDGVSWVATAVAAGGPYATLEWRQEHVAGLHVTELAGAAAAGVALDSTQRVLATLSRAALAGLRVRPATVLDARWVLVRRRDASPSLAYLAFPRADWDDHVAAAGLQTAPARPDCHGVTPGDGLCWAESADALAAQRWTQRALAGGLGLLALAVAWLGIGRVRAARRAREDRLFALRTLGHELRTPITELTLAVDALREHFDRLPAAGQTAFLRLGGGVGRLRRAVAASSRFLRLEGDGGEVRVAAELVPSVRDFVAEVADGWEDEVEVALAGDDRAFRTDPEWLEVCLQNLIANAFVHGRPPVAVRIAWAGERLRLSVGDAGDTGDLTLEAMAAPFERGDASKGLGLGLSIVARAARALGGRLTHAPSPTTFTLELPELAARGEAVGSPQAPRRAR